MTMISMLHRRYSSASLVVARAMLMRTRASVLFCYDAIRSYANDGIDVDEVRAGNAKAMNALVGQAMKATKGKANPAQVNELLKKKLG